ncbi:hypothetical protein VOLCADRAFT_102659 [Volvox carteri f. nagariensis]|uniref:Uncharacterized protein n=1 Tax=Volvox carteri f. nagariensis TaxID=3068 RepID=D8THB3_VOLCA|nr:uncharacterized protein VOLCADRAFT_102659 [Volvox carteri f. nagariensis]EFJ53041.1 hypothetical protein VOLCADRAFT_102659 [Volvox carteri f. nagariensis]|eukprot:XP_002946046.1 hypothetical protein VOLCADRAFT_102659 [Volvox carteri f. nagariensis]
MRLQSEVQRAQHLFCVSAQQRHLLLGELSRKKPRARGDGELPEGGTKGIFRNICISKACSLLVYLYKDMVILLAFLLQVISVFHRAQANAVIGQQEQQQHDRRKSSAASALLRRAVEVLPQRQVALVPDGPLQGITSLPYSIASRIEPLPQLPRAPAGDHSNHEAVLEALLCQHFDIVFRIATCKESGNHHSKGGRKSNVSSSNSSSHKAAPATAEATHGSSDSSHPYRSTAGGKGHSRPRRRVAVPPASVMQPPQPPPQPPPPPSVSVRGSSGRRGAASMSHHFGSTALCLWSYRLVTSAANTTHHDEGTEGDDRSGGGGGAGSRRRILGQLLGVLGPDGLVSGTGGLAATHQVVQRQQQQQQQREREEMQPELEAKQTQLQGALDGWNGWRRRKLQHLLRTNRSEAAEAAEMEKGSNRGSGDGNAGTVVLTEEDLSPYNSVWPMEALAYRAHLTALRLCSELLLPPPPPVQQQQHAHDLAVAREMAAAETEPRLLLPPPAARGGSAGACAVITDHVGWVAAADIGALERALRREGVSSAAAVVAAAAATSASPPPMKSGPSRPQRPIFAGRDMVEINATLSALVDSFDGRSGTLTATSIVSASVDVTAAAAETETAVPMRRESLLGVVPWGNKYLNAVKSSVDGGGGGGDAMACTGVYVSREEWLSDLADGLTELRRRRVPTAAKTAGDVDSEAKDTTDAVVLSVRDDDASDGDGGGSGGPGGGVLGIGWDVLALPSACAGWTVSGHVDANANADAGADASSCADTVAAVDGNLHNGGGDGGGTHHNDNQNGMSNIGTSSRSSSVSTGRSEIPRRRRRGRLVPPPRPSSGVAGCILAFSAEAAAALGLLAARTYPYNATDAVVDITSHGANLGVAAPSLPIVPGDLSGTPASGASNCTAVASAAASGPVTAASAVAASQPGNASCISPQPPPRHSYTLLPVINTPLFAKLSLLARQGVLSLAISSPPPPRSPATPQRPEADGSDTASATAAAAPPPPPRQRRRFLLYTCAGDQGIWRMWANPNRNYDLLVAYYGVLDLDDPRVRGGPTGGVGVTDTRVGTRCTDSTGSKVCGGIPGASSRLATDPWVAGASGGRPDYVYRAHGSKHQNLYKLHSLHPGLLASYDAVAVWDDDLEATAAHVSGMFERFSELSGPPGHTDGIWLAQPSLRYGSKVDHALLVNQPMLRLSYTSFVENNACVFRSDKLREVLESPLYSGELMGWGVDYAYLAVLGPRLRNRFAVLHDFEVLNPPSEAKAEGREILKLASQEDRIRQWESYKAKFGIEVEPEVVYECIPALPDLPPWQYPTYCPEYQPQPPLPVRPGVNRQASKQVSITVQRSGVRIGDGRSGR